MKTFLFSSFLIAAASLLDGVSAQYVSSTYTDPGTGITFGQISIPAPYTTGGFTWGIALPPEAATTDYPDYIGMITGSLVDGAGWSGVSHSTGMPNGLLLMVWAYQGKIYHSFRNSAGYTEPAIYNGNVSFVPISETIGTSNFTVIYKCVNCLVGSADGSVVSSSTSDGLLLSAWAQHNAFPLTPTDPNSGIVQHNNGNGIFPFVVASLTNAKYTDWATKTISSVPTTTATNTVTTTTYSSRTIPTGVTYDYVIAGGGAGGIPFADKASAAGKKTLLIEKGPPSTGRWGGTMKPNWLSGTSLTRFDVPGLCNEIWVNSAGVACPDIGHMAGCVLGGGVAVNAGLWWKPNPKDWDVNFPAGWKSADMVAATNRVFTKIPGTDHPSQDGKLYLQEGFNVLSSGLANAGWTSVVPNNAPGSKNRTYGHTEYMYIGGERGGPLATYLVSSAARSNFVLWTNTTVKRLIRTGGHVTGLEVEPFGDGGYKGIVNVTTNTGRVVLSSGTFGSAKILFRSGIGPTDQLTIVNNSVSDGKTMINQNDWINLPVGYNLDDHTNTDLIISHPNVTFYDFYQAWTDPIAADKDAYLNKRSGILAQAAPNIGPMFWEEIIGADGIARSLQWTARVEGNGSPEAPNGKTMTLSQYLGRGSLSRGRATIKGDLSIGCSDPANFPYLKDQYDIAAVVQGIKNVQKALNTVKNLTFVHPPPGQTVEDYVASLPATPAARSANHWTGSSKLGTDDGRVGGTAVVNLNAQVYGTDNLFVVDASIFPGMVTTNPAALVVVASERASDLILALTPLAPVVRWGQCGGRAYSGSMVCGAPYTCIFQNEYYSQCL